MDFSDKYHADGGLWRPLLDQGLEEDGWRLDWTTLSALSEEQRFRPIEARVMAKGRGIWAAEGLGWELERVSAGWGMPVKVQGQKRDGEVLERGDLVCTLVGPARAILALERPFLNLAGFVSGIATRTHAMVEKVKQAAGPGAAPRVTSTRKMLPGYRDLSIHGVICGGGSAHRANLFSGVLIKENHVAAAGGIASAVKSARLGAPHGLRIEVEVRNEAELEQALEAGAEIVMLDNFDPARARAAVAFAKKKNPAVLIEVSGGLDADNIANYVFPGVDILSSGSITHSAGALDLSLLMGVAQ